MKTTKFIRLLLYFPILVLVLVTSCTTEDSDSEIPQGTISLISLEDNEYLLDENADSLVLRLKIAPKATTEGTVHLNFSGNAHYNQDYTTIPPSAGNQIAIPFSPAQEFVNLVLHRKFSEEETEKELQVRLVAVPGGFKIEEPASATVMIAPRLKEINPVNFEYTSLKVRENETGGLNVLLNWSQPTSKSEQITLKMITTDQNQYGERFTTTPQPVLGEIKIDVLPGATSASFSFKPVNDQVLKENAVVKFQINALSSGLHAGESNTLEITLEDDDRQTGTVHKLAEVRELFEGRTGDWYFPEDYVVEGVITSDQNVLDDKTVYLQDETAGIMIRFFLARNFKIGDKIRLNLKSATGTHFNGQKSIDQVNPEGSVLISENMIVQAEEITLDQFLSGDYEGKRVLVRNVSFVNADGNITFLGSRTITDDVRVASVITYASAAFSNTVLPAGQLSISGIVGDWGRIMPQQYSQDIIKL
ncbi:DUF5689 domain-containing protein [Zeaxanthinibacter enoshimensis]|uniref:DUF5689 domain-containing protein n=1 Tax=Zeaxanthinibacter enoshimensis TaxID=392009 RepID=A0A4R6TMP2_9FLAO|nr:DUF5689 domain-containing protein [Zeaxanthinibacter enoshimensis]TDQ29361.1 hypothetical protein CLV82_2818 [Zeaxanthinibacter enoshimensis]